LAWQTVSPEAQQHLQAAAEAERQKQFDRAVSEFRKSLSWNQDRPMALSGWDKPT